MGARQMCPECGSPLDPCKCERTAEPRAWNSTLAAGRKARPRSFTERTRNATARYGPLFRAIRDLPCWLDSVGYRGSGHRRCGPGVQGGHTAHHVARTDAQGLLPGCGAAHDLYAGYGGAETVAEFRAFLDFGGYELERVALAYVRGAGAGLPPRTSARP